MSLKFVCHCCENAFEQHELKKLRENKDLIWLVCPDCDNFEHNAYYPELHPILLEDDNSG